jgi:hypothetical protein
MFPTVADVPNQWSWQEWQGSNFELHQVLRGDPRPEQGRPESPRQGDGDSGPARVGGEICGHFVLYVLSSFWVQRCSGFT